MQGLHNYEMEIALKMEFEVTNNKAEYEPLIAEMELAIKSRLET